MKKIIILFNLFILVNTTKSQSVLKIELGNKNAGLSIGHQLGDYGITGGYIAPYRSSEQPLILHVSVDKRILLFDIDESTNNAIYLIPSIGISRATWKDFSHYEEAPDYRIIKETKYLPIVGLSIGKSANIGMATASIRYCKNFFVSIGLSVYIGYIK